MPDWVSQIGVIIALVVGLGVVAQFLRGSRDKGTIATLESSNDALLQWQTVAKGEIADLKADAVATKKVHDAETLRLSEEAKAQRLLHDAEVKALDLRIAALEAENERLHSVRPSAEVLAELVTAAESLRAHMEQHDAEIKALIARTAAGKAAT